MKTKDRKKISRAKQLRRKQDDKNGVPRLAVTIKSPIQSEK